ncbi:uncharacterized protein F4812DRAFT_410899 [Daldinia caldariorum]|uniref:uncharacterized protein n=1 Tax=Daldinia caldariorum TaxID=326644 RepID=UPI0020077B8E|nr:uncharacterized protein F4812DRAFT_410899 [Daldinia caldariorum]KAI1472922.1 hypothetical protein F4812DRAFT_410899 [Daldinia caldariorum]
MGHRFPKTISAARIATFVSTAAWIQGASASEVSLPEEALNNFLRRHGVIKSSRRQAPAPAPASEGEEDDDDEEGEEEEDGESSVDSPSSVDSSSSSGSSSSGDAKDEKGEKKEDDDDDTPSLPESPQAGVALGAADHPAIGTVEPPGSLSTGARVAIGVWSAVGVLAILGLIFFFCRRRRRARMAQMEINALRDEELAQSHQERMSQISMPLPPPPPPVPPVPVPMPMPVMEQVHLRGASDTGDARPPSGQWLATPPWQEDPPTWRDSHPWRQSQPSVAGGGGGGFAGVPRPLFAPPVLNQEEYSRRNEF